MLNRSDRSIAALSAAAQAVKAQPQPETELSRLSLIAASQYARSNLLSTLEALPPDPADILVIEPLLRLREKEASSAEEWLNRMLDSPPAASASQLTDALLSKSGRGTSKASSSLKKAVSPTARSTGGSTSPPAQHRHMLRVSPACNTSLSSMSDQNDFCSDSDGGGDSLSARRSVGGTRNLRVKEIIVGRTLSQNPLGSLDETGGSGLVSGVTFLSSEIHLVFLCLNLFVVFACLLFNQSARMVEG